MVCVHLRPWNTHERRTRNERSCLSIFHRKGWPALGYLLTVKFLWRSDKVSSTYTFHGTRTSLPSRSFPHLTKNVARVRRPWQRRQETSAPGVSKATGPRPHFLSAPARFDIGDHRGIDKNHASLNVSLQGKQGEHPRDYNPHLAHPMWKAGSYVCIVDLGTRMQGEPEINYPVSQHLFDRVDRSSDKSWQISSSEGQIRCRLHILPTVSEQVFLAAPCYI